MPLTLYAHPFSSYCQKALIAFWEKGIDFAYRHLEEPGASEELAQLWPIGRFPVLLTEEGQAIAETSIIIEYIDLLYPDENPLLPRDPLQALDIRFLDRFFDNYVMNITQKPVFVALCHGPERRDEALAEASRALDLAYDWLDKRLVKTDGWIGGGNFSLADCAAAPSLFYADWVHPIDPAFARLRAYRARLLERPSFARAVEEGRPYRSYFPLGAPDRD